MKTKVHIVVEDREIDEPLIHSVWLDEDGAKREAEKVRHDYNRVHIHSYPIIDDNQLTIKFGLEEHREQFLAWFKDGGGDQEFAEYLDSHGHTAFTYGEGLLTIEPRDKKETFFYTEWVELPEGIVKRDSLPLSHKESVLQLWIADFGDAGQFPWIEIYGAIPDALRLRELGL